MHKKCFEKRGSCEEEQNKINSNCAENGWEKKASVKDETKDNPKKSEQEREKSDNERKRKQSRHVEVGHKMGLEAPPCGKRAT